MALPRLPVLLALSLVALMPGCSCNKQPPPKETLKNEGEACASDEQCVTGLCDGLPGAQATCVRKCSTTCLTGEVCTQLTANRFACQPDTRKLCQPCQVDADCPYPADKCLVVNGEHVCGRDCAYDQNCPTGYRCVNGVGTDGLPKVEQCTPVNASCACLARADFMQPCDVTNSFGTCTGIKQCDLVHNTVACDARTPAAEVCNGVDDNCNGTIDEGQAMVTCGVGACQRTVSSCGGDGGTVVCTPGDAGVETCNAIDDDCDGVVDNGFDTGNDVKNCGSCGHACALAHATPACTGSACVVSACDADWGNCNAQDPDGCEAHLPDDAMNCGHCGTVCSQQNATASCVTGSCQFVCKPGFIDLNQDPSDGCEYQCTFVSSVDLPNLGFADANCDGIDGEIANGVFVAPRGLDANPGTRKDPKLTLAAAVTAAVTSGKRDVYVAGGTYTGPLEIQGSSGLNVAGGYDQTTWKRALTNTTTVQGGNPSLKIEGASNVLIQALSFVGADGDAVNVAAYGGWVKESSAVKFESLTLQAGAGAAGLDGTDGTPGLDGGVGGAGDPGSPAPGGGGAAGQWVPTNTTPAPGSLYFGGAGSAGTTARMAPTAAQGASRRSAG
jgi:hypothetical protein